MIAVSLVFGSSIAFATQQDSNTQQGSNSSTKNQSQPVVSSPTSVDTTSATPQTKNRSAHIGRDICKTHRNLPQCRK